MRHIAIVGSGPAGYYTAEACQTMFGQDARIDILDRLPVPYGLIRFGVAPDHQAIKAVARRYEQVALHENVRFVGNVVIGRDVAIPELLDLYDAVVLATGAPSDRPLDIPGADLPGVVGSAAFVGWYNGHPEHGDLAPPLNGPGAVIIGNGNVALDVARILAKTPEEFSGSDIVDGALSALRGSQIRHISIIGRRGPLQTVMSAKEVEELAALSRAAPHVDPADLPPPASEAALDAAHRKTVTLLRGFAGSKSDKAVPIDLRFFTQPVAIEGDRKVERVIVERTRLDENGRAIGTGERQAIPCSLVVRCIGYRTPPIEGVPYDAAAGRFASEDGRVAHGLYCVGWARRGPTGTIGTNRPDGYRIVEKIGADVTGNSGKPGRAGLDALLEERGVDIITFRDWQKIEAAENERARPGAPRGKFTSIAEMIAAQRVS